MVDLKPCPFCGSATAPTLLEKRAEDSLSRTKPYFKQKFWVVICSAFKDGCGASAGCYRNSTTPVDQWNTRT